MPPSGLSASLTHPTHPLQPNSAVIEQVIGREAVQCSSVAALAFLAWDLLITFDDEVKFIWTKQWTIIKYLYFFVRYIPLLFQISILFVGTDISIHLHYTSHDCYVWQIIQGIASLAIVGTVDVILVLRVIALYHGNSIMRSIIVMLYVLELVGMSVGLGLAIPNIEYDDICLVIGVPRSLFVYGGTAMSFQIILFILTLVKFLEAIRSGWGDVPLVLLLVRDGTWAFMLLMAVYVGHAAVYALKNHALAGLLYGWLLTALSFSGYRIVLNLNHAIPPERQPSDMHRTNTDLQFTTQIFSDVTDNPTASFELLFVTNDSNVRLYPSSSQSGD